MTESLKNLPKERYLEEFKKLFLKSPKPSVGLQIAWDLGIFETIFPEFRDFETTQQHPEHHPEGNLWVHNLLCVDKMAELLKDSELSDDDKFMLFLAIWCHDLGKPSTTELIDGQWKSYGHDEAGAEPTLSFLDKLGVDHSTRDKVVKLVVHHLKPILLYNEKSKPAAVRRLARKLHPASINELLFVACADKGGRGVEVDYSFVDWIRKTADEYKVTDKPPAPIVSGKELIEMGFEPGIYLGHLIKHLNRLYEEEGYAKQGLLNYAGDVLFYGKFPLGDERI